MKTIKSLVIAAMAVFATTANAQETTSMPHWYIQANGGAQYTLGEAKFSKLLSPNVQLGIGYNFNSVLGLRLTANGWISKGGWADNTNYKWTYVAPQLDLTVNISNAISGYNPSRIVDFSIFGGGACNVAWHNTEAQALAGNYSMTYLWDGTKVRPFGHFGLDIDFKLCKRVAINLEGAANVGSDKYNSKKGSNADWYFNALLGVKINLGSLGEKKAVPVTPLVAAEPTPEPVATPEPKPEPKPVEVKKATEKTINVFFTVAASEISATEQYKIQDMVAFLKDNPSAKVSVTGYADAGTGNPTINMQFSQDRANAVTKALVDAGIAADRITTVAKGDTVQPFSENDSNRVCIAIGK